MKGRVQSAEVSYIAHATEDEGKLVTVVERMLGVSDPDVEELQGHHGNRILRVRHSVTGEAAANLFDRVMSGIEPDSRKEIAGNLRELIDEHHALYLRLSKQALFKGELEIGGRDSVRVRIKPRLFLLKEGAEAFYREALEKEE